MSGNVWEWCQDLIVYKYSSERVFRGGSWYIDAGYCAVTYSHSNDPGTRGIGIGFRLACSLN
jgi:formylglycine-generating enzyme required for sulfatase activity